jgi:hypothetical protein
LIKVNEGLWLRFRRERNSDSFWNLEALPKRNSCFAASFASQRGIALRRGGRRFLDFLTTEGLA